LRENTLPSFARALELGAEGIELDVHATADGVVVVHHDAEVVDGDRVVPIAALMWGDLERIQLPGGASVPTLAAVMEFVNDRVPVYVEVKAPGIEDVLLESLARWPTAPAHSFDHRIVREIRNREPGRPVGVLLSSRLIDTVAAVNSTGATALWMHWSMIDRELVEAAHGAAMEVIAWTVNEAPVARRLVGYGVDALCTDDCGAIAAALEMQG